MEPAYPAVLTEFAVRAIAIGIGATVVMDLWSLVQKRLLGVPGLDFRFVGRWVAHLPRGQFFHAPIAASPAVRGEAAIGWATHYATGIVFAAALLGLCGLDWAHRPTPWPALLIGIATVAAPFLVMQPGMGAGLAARRTPHPATARVRSLVAHLSFGVGLYLAALATAGLRFTV